jgi:hypothetical protein
MDEIILTGTTVWCSLYHRACWPGRGAGSSSGPQLHWACGPIAGLCKLERLLSWSSRNPWAKHGESCCAPLFPVRQRRRTTPRVSYRGQRQLRRPGVVCGANPSLSPGLSTPAPADVGAPAEEATEQPPAPVARPRPRRQRITVPRHSTRLAAKSACRNPVPERQARRVLLSKWSRRSSNPRSSPDDAIATRFRETFKELVSSSAPPEHEAAVAVRAPALLRHTVVST